MLKEEKKKKILIFSLVYLPRFIGGAEIALRELTDRFPKDKFELHMITSRMTRVDSSCEEVGNIKVHRVGIGLKLDKFFIIILGLLKAIKLHKEIKFNYVWQMMANQSSIAAGLFKKANPEVKLILTMQEGDEEEHLSRYVFGNKFLFKIFILPLHTFVIRNADHITAISNYLKNRAAKHNDGASVDLIPNGVDLKNFEPKQIPREEFGYKKEDKIILSVSRLVKKNAISDLILSLSHLDNKYKLLIIGDGGERHKLGNIVRDNRLDERVRFLGKLDNREISKYFAIADVFVRPSLSEGQGISFIEAMAMKVPVIATPVGGIPDFLIDKETGLFCEVDNPKDVAKKVEEIDEDSLLREKIVKNAGVMVEEKYNWENLSEKTAAVFSGEITRKKILIATGIYPPEIGGPAKYAQNIRKTLRKMGFRAPVATYGKLMKLPTGIRHILYLLRLIPKMIGSDFVLILDTFSAGLPAVILSKILGKRTIVRTGGDFLWESYVERTGDLVLLRNFYDSRKPFFTKKEKIIYKITNFILKNSTHIVFSTNWQREIFINEYDIDFAKTSIIENFYGEKEESVDDTDKTYIGSVRDLKWKNVVRVKKAFSELNNSEFTFLTEQMSGGKLREKMKSCYAVILVSLGDISPNLVIEALAMNKPVILTYETGLYPKLKDVVMFADPENVGDIKKKILMMNDPKIYNEYKEKVKNFNFTHSWEEIVDEFLNVYKEICP